MTRQIRHLLEDEPEGGESQPACDLDAIANACGVSRRVLLRKIGKAEWHWCAFGCGQVDTRHTGHAMCCHRSFSSDAAFDAAHVRTDRGRLLCLNPEFAFDDRGEELFELGTSSPSGGKVWHLRNLAFAEWIATVSRS